MNIQELHKELEELGVPEGKYYLHGLYGSTSDEEKIALSIKGDWCRTEYEVYFKERGEKHSVRRFNTEAEACEYVYNKLREHKEIEDKFSK